MLYHYLQLYLLALHFGAVLVVVLVKPPLLGLKKKTTPIAKSRFCFLQLLFLEFLQLLFLPVLGDAESELGTLLKKESMPIFLLFLFISDKLIQLDLCLSAYCLQLDGLLSD